MVETQRVALITGASGGIGAAIAMHLAREGVFVLVTSRSVKRCAVVCAEIEAAGGRAAAVELDVGEVQSIRSLPERIAESSAPAPVSWLVNNAGVAISAPLLNANFEAAEELALRHMNLNFHGPRRLIQLFGAGMVERGYGRIVSVASSAGLQGYPYVADYCASKHALVGYSRTASLELGPKGVFLNLVCPHYVDTPMTAEAIDRVMEKTGRSAAEARSFFEGQNPGGRLVTVYEVASAVWELCHGEDNGRIYELTGSDA